MTCRFVFNIVLDRFNMIINLWVESFGLCRERLAYSVAESDNYSNELSEVCNLMIISGKCLKFLCFLPPPENTQATPCKEKLFILRWIQQNFIFPGKVCSSLIYRRNIQSKSESVYIEHFLLYLLIIQKVSLKCLHPISS